jgi:hypothetical protein
MSKVRLAGPRISSQHRDANLNGSGGGEMKELASRTFP